MHLAAEVKGRVFCSIAIIGVLCLFESDIGVSVSLFFSTQRRERRERDVRRLREEISSKKTAVAMVTKGIPFNRIEVRPEDQLPPQSFGQTQHQLATVPALAVALAEAMPPATVAAAAAAAARAAGVMPVPRSQVTFTSRIEYRSKASAYESLLRSWPLRRWPPAPWLCSNSNRCYATSSSSGKMGSSRGLPASRRCHK